MTIIVLLLGCKGRPLKYAKGRVLAVVGAAFVLFPLTEFLAFQHFITIFLILVTLSGFFIYFMLGKPFWKYFWIHIFILVMLSSVTALTKNTTDWAGLSYGLIYLRVGFTILGVTAFIMGVITIKKSLESETIRNIFKIKPQ